MHTTRGEVATRALLVALPLGFLAVFFVWPVAALIWRGLGDEPTAVIDLWRSGRNLRILWFTLWQAVVSTVATFVLAWPLTMVMARWQFAGKRVVRALITVPFVLPTIVVAAAFIALADRTGLDDGWLSLRRSTLAILSAHVFFNIAVVVRTVGGFWEQLDNRPEQAASVLGARPLRVFWEVTLPRLRRIVASAAIIIFLFTFTSFAVILVLGGPTKSTLETEIFRHAVTRSDFATGAALATVQIVAVAGIVVLSMWARRGATTRGLGASRARRVPPGRRAPVALTVAASVGLLMTPIVVLVERSLRVGDSWTLSNYRALTGRPRLLSVTGFGAIANSLTFAIVAAAIALLVGGAASLVIVHGRGAARRLIDLGALLPIGTSAVTLGFGFLIALDEPPLDLRSSWWIVPIAQSLIGIPFVVRAVVPVLRAIEPEWRDAAASLGASPARVRREIDVPIAARALLVGLGFAFAVSLGEFGATSFVGRRPDLMTVPIAISRLLGQPGDVLRGQAMALSVVLMVVTTLAVALLDRSDRNVLL